MVAPARQVLRLVLTNHSQETIEVSVTDVKSLLGNFAIRPDRLVLAPQQPAAIDPLFGNFPENLDALEVEVRLRRNGKTETQLLRLIPAPPSAATAPAATPPSVLSSSS